MTSTYNRTMNESFEESVVEVCSIRKVIAGYETALQENGATLLRAVGFKDGTKPTLSVRNNLTEKDKLALGEYCKNFISDDEENNCLKDGYIIEREGFFSFIFRIKKNGRMISRVLSINEEASTEKTIIYNLYDYLSEYEDEDGNSRISDKGLSKKEFFFKKITSDDGLSCDIAFCLEGGLHECTFRDLIMQAGKRRIFEEIELLKGLKQAVEHLDAKLRMLRKKDESKFQMQLKDGYSLAKRLERLHEEYSEDSVSLRKIWGILNKVDCIDTEKDYVFEDYRHIPAHKKYSKSYVDLSTVDYRRFSIYRHCDGFVMNDD